MRRVTDLKLIIHYEEYGRYDVICGRTYSREYLWMRRMASGSRDGEEYHYSVGLLAVKRRDMTFAEFEQGIRDKLERHGVADCFAVRVYSKTKRVSEHRAFVGRILPATRVEEVEYGW